MLCSCLDVIGDTELALDAFLEQGHVGNDGKSYLLFYGALQVLVVQQDAVKNLAKALNVNNNTPDDFLEMVREIRNDSIGHPTKRILKKRKGKDSKNSEDGSSNRIIRMSFSHDGFDLIKHYPDKPPEIVSVNVTDLIQKQRAKLIKKLDDIAISLKENEMKHKRTFKNVKLQDFFHSTIDYNFEKIHGACDGNESPEFGLVAIRITLDDLEKFKAALLARGILQAYDGVLDDFELTVYSLNELKTYLKKPSDSHLNEKGAHIFAFFARKNIEELIKTAKYIDEEYASEK